MAYMWALLYPATGAVEYNPDPPDPDNPDPDPVDPSDPDPDPVDPDDDEPDPPDPEECYAVVSLSSYSASTISSLGYTPIDMGALLKAFEQAEGADWSGLWGDDPVVAMSMLMQAIYGVVSDVDGPTWIHGAGGVHRGAQWAVVAWMRHHSYPVKS